MEDLDNYPTVIRVMNSTAKSQIYGTQLRDLAGRDLAREISAKEINVWEHNVANPQSKSAPLRSIQVKSMMNSLRNLMTTFPKSTCVQIILSPGDNDDHVIIADDARKITTVD